MSEIEKQFFVVFEIEPKCYCGNEYIFEAMLENKCTDGNLEKCKTCEKVGRTYPQITDRILLELICIKNKELISIVQVKGKNLEELKSSILQMCIKDYMNYSSYSLSTYRELADNLKHQIQALFKENN